MILAQLRHSQRGVARCSMVHGLQDAAQMVLAETA